MGGDLLLDIARMSGLVAFPFFAGLAVLAEPILAVVFGSDWAPAAPVLTVMSFLGLYFCIAMAAFSLSRGVGHMIRIILVYSDQSDLWKQLSPFSGGFNTVLMVSAAAVTIYYHKGLAAYKAIRSKAEMLAEANTNLATSAEQLQLLNTHLEEMVEERTRNLSESEKKFRTFFEN